MGGTSAHVGNGPRCNAPIRIDGARSSAACRVRYDDALHAEGFRLRSLLEQYGLAILFGNLLLERIGLPIPAVPALVAAGGLAADGHYPIVAVLALAMAACMIGDGALYLVGRCYGAGVLRLLCGISLSPDSCVRQTSLHFDRWGGWTLVLGKFLPGVATIAPPLAGVMRVDAARFLLL